MTEGASGTSSIDWHQWADGTHEQRREILIAHLDRLGMPEPKGVAQPFARLLDVPSFVIAADRVLRHLASVGSPARSIATFEEAFLALEDKRGNGSPLLVEPILRTFLELSGASTFASRLLTVDPSIAIELATRFDHNAPPVDLHEQVRRIVSTAAGNTERLDERLRAFRNRHILRLALRELRGVDIRETASELANLASAALDGALEHHRTCLVARYGEPDPPCAAAIIGMGKLGGRELNFSSDIDVIHFYEHDLGGVGDLSVHEFMVKLFERVGSSLSRVTPFGFVFRVDTDLRPEGKKGPLANSLASAERYYQTFGRTWERAAWTRARPVAGNAEFGVAILEMMRPFVWRKTFDLRAIDEIGAMKDKIDLARHRQSPPDAKDMIDLKLGQGGIREIEFFVQAHQLLHGGRITQLRTANTSLALNRLETAGIISTQLKKRLSDAYLFLRTVEHRLQLVDDRQTHTLPRETDARDAVARSLGLSSGAALLDRLRPCMRDVHSVFVRMLGHASGAEPIPEFVLLLLDPDVDDATKVAVFANHGARDPDAALASLHASMRILGGPFHPAASDAYRRVAEHLLLECKESPDFDRALRHLPDLVRSVSVHGALVEDLMRPQIVRGVCRVLGASELLARTLVTHPAMLPAVLAPEAALHPLEAHARASLDDEVVDIEAALESLRTIKHEETLKTALADMAGLLDVHRVQARLTSLAERLVTDAFILARHAIVELFGEPLPSTQGPPPDVVVVALGTCGAAEMGYRSDLDLMAIFVGEGETSGGRRSGISCAEYFTRLMQKLVQFLVLKTPQGDLYPPDMRLRPSGSQGPLVVSLSKFSKYHQTSAELWESQALTRARPIIGPKATCAWVNNAIVHAAYEGKRIDDIPARVHEMRVRMERERTGRADPNTLDVKLGRGGLVEIEFLVQALLLEHGRTRPELRQTSTHAALGCLHDAGLLDDAPRLQEAHAFLRRVQNWLRLMHDATSDRVVLLDDALRPLAVAIGYAGNDAAARLRRDLAETCDLVNSIYTRRMM